MDLTMSQLFQTNLTFEDIQQSIQQANQLGIVPDPDDYYGEEPEGEYDEADLIAMQSAMQAYFSGIGKEKSIDKLKILTFEEVRAKGQADQTCAICLMTFEEMPEEQVRQLPCSHIYHKGCVDKWLKDNSVCPTCKGDINTEAPQI